MAKFDEFDVTVKKHNIKKTADKETVYEVVLKPTLKGLATSVSITITSKDKAVFNKYPMKSEHTVKFSTSQSRF